jgi:kinesin family member 1
MIGYAGNKGIVPKVCDEIFNRIKNKPADDTTNYEVEFSMMEIYNEKV